MSKSRTVDWTTKTESFFRNFINMVTYAAIADVTDEHVGDGESEKYDPVVWQSYDNLQLPKDDRDTTVKNVFTVGTEVNQFFRIILSKVVEDIRDSGCTSTDTIETLRQKLSSDSYLSLVLDNASKYKPTKRVSLHVDSTIYLSGRLKSELGPSFLDKPVIVVSVAEEFYKFVKQFALTFANSNWYTGDSMTENVVLGLFKVALEFSNDKLIELKSQKKPKVTKVTKKKQVEEVAPEATEDSASAESSKEPSQSDETLEDELADI